MANSLFNPAQDVQFSASQFGQQKLSDRDKVLIEALLFDSGVFDMVAAPTPTPGPAPAPSPTPAPAPAPTPAASQASSPALNLFVQLALNKIRPGDLITAQFANDLVDAALSLDARLRVLEGANRITSTPTPTPGTSPTPSSSAELSATGPGRAEASDAPKPTIDKITATTVRGKGVTVAVAGDNIGEGQIERVLLGATQIAPSSIKFVRGGGGFTFTTTTAIVEKSKNRLTVVTDGGQDSAALSAGGGKAPVL
ncbi:hypothetical protein FHS95_000446 [Sphingomonas naasensis]|uniref:hypothetical protein n=1 Tax=Sphingomonas naasensis TaxID=1344951 RepID=UPI0019D236A8|nr:hypothetical protein [Sphingomonas naasensis]NIJ18777.1 hypothetical protein [Sphingomonas naasensis]